MKTKIAAIVTGLMLCATTSASAAELPDTINVPVHPLPKPNPGKPRTIPPSVSATFSEYGIEVNISSYSGNVDVSLYDSAGNAIASESIFVYGYGSITIYNTTTLAVGTYVLYIETECETYEGTFDVR